MKKLKIIDENYYKLLTGILSALLLYNIYAVITTQNLIGVLPVLIQSVLVYLLITKNVLCQKAIACWIVVVFFGAQGLRIIGIAMQAWAKNMKGQASALDLLASDRILFSIILVIVGVIIWILNRRFAEIVESDEESEQLD